MYFEDSLNSARRFSHSLARRACIGKNWAEDARAYNEVVTSWSGIESAAAREPGMKQGELF